MKKLALDLETLDVESFEIAGRSEAERGTVNGQAKYTYACNTEVDCATQGGDTCNGTCGEGVTCDATCLYSCYNSCHIHDSCDTSCGW